MRACQIIEYNKTHQIRQIPIPSTSSLRPHELLLKIAVSSLCHSDLEYQSGTLSNTLPVTASHEGTGTVIAAGSAATAFSIGDRIMAGQTFDRCGECDDCRGPEAYQHYCSHQGPMMSTQRNGAFQEYLVVDARQATRIPEGMSFLTAAPLACAGVTVWRGILNAEVPKGGWIGIVGSGGGLGHLGVQFARARGLRVVGVDARDEGLDLTDQVGADLVVDARLGKEEVVRRVMEATEGRGVDGTVTLSDAKSAAAMGCAITRKHGTMVYIPVGHALEIPFEEVIFRDVRIKGSFLCSPREATDMLECVVQHGIKVQSTIFHGLEEVPKAVEQLRAGTYQGKGVIVVDEEAAKAVR
ncbi:GroES-like protein [Lophium mytilinum]|uniref:GroES-like protein n=1 Tax=Lophium mytilinum TaxID=390894 RepID=A0A6A6QAK5_9PEZI|nr:GroES-like protein [Lophium mytilinum]